MRVLDMAKGCVTPVIVMQDAHKHIGTDKGLSTIVGTNGILSHLDGYRKVGFQPQVPDLVRAPADVKSIGNQEYVNIYTDFSKTVASAVQRMEDAGMKVMFRQNRVFGSTVVAFEDPSGA